VTPYVLLTVLRVKRFVEKWASICAKIIDFGGVVFFLFASIRTVASSVLSAAGFDRTNCDTGN